MSDVESGGYTVFLNAEAVVKPTKVKTEITDCQLHKKITCIAFPVF